MPRDFQIVLTDELRRYIADPPPDSALARAQRFGFDVVALAIKLATTTPEQRLANLDERFADAHALRRGLQ